MIGQTLDHYRIESKLGEGGMGVVYEARDTFLNRRVAIKVLRSDKVTDPSRKQRFVREATAASALNHPNVVTIYDIRCDCGIDFIVMERIEGETLDHLIAPQGIQPAQALKYAVQMADGLAKAHAVGILHRDLKPSNVMVTAEGDIKILDFGLAKLLDPEETSPEATTLTARQFTEEGHVVGTIAYMSPEQAEGRKLDGRSDIFSFGSVLYEMTTGRRPFVGDSRLSILTGILRDDPTPPAQLAPLVPPQIETIILRCLQKDPERRFQTMADLKLALEGAQAKPLSAGKARHAPPWRHWVWAGLLPVPVIAGFLAWRLSRPQETTEPLRAVPLTTLPGILRYPSFSPDGDRVAFSWHGPKQDNPDIYLYDAGRGRQASKPHLPPFDRRHAELLEKRPMDVLRLGPNGPVSNMENAGSRRGCGPGHPKRRNASLGVARRRLYLLRADAGQAGSLVEDASGRQRSRQDVGQSGSNEFCGARKRHLLYRSDVGGRCHPLYRPSLRRNTVAIL
jgi:serine/threonine protein kinase